MRFVFLLCALVCALIGAAVAIDIIDLREHTMREARYAMGWASFSFAAYITASLVGDRR